MKKAFVFATIGLLAIALAPLPAQSASLLGGLLNTGADSGNSSGLISNNSNGSIGVGGSNGVSVNLGGLSGGLGGLGGGLGGNGNTGVPGVAEVSSGQSSGGGSTVGVNLLGGGGTNLGVNPLGLLGNGGGLNVSLPGLGGLGLNGQPGAPGTPGTPGSNGVGYNGSNGYNGYGYNGSNGYNGINGLDGISSRLRKILQILADRDWISLENGRAVCLNNFGATEISQILPQKDWPAFNRALPSYAQDIATLRQLLANCRSTTQRQALNVRDLNRVIGIDIAQNGTPVLYFL